MIKLCLYYRVEEGFVQLRFPESCRSIFVRRIANEGATLEINQPSDCFVLRRNHIQCNDVNELHVRFGSEFAKFTNGHATAQPTELWLAAVKHILDTYRPVVCYVVTMDSHTMDRKDFHVEVTEGLRYIAFWNSDQDSFVLRM